jgi:hypothetical protein
MKYYIIDLNDLQIVSNEIFNNGYINDGYTWYDIERIDDVTPFQSYSDAQSALKIENEYWKNSVPRSFMILTENELIPYIL